MSDSAKLWTVAHQPPGSSVHGILQARILDSRSAQSCPTLCNPVNCSIPAFTVLTISQSMLKLMSTESVMPSNHLILCCPLLFLKSTMNLHRPQNINILILPEFLKLRFFCFCFSVLYWNGNCSLNL